MSWKEGDQCWLSGQDTAPMRAETGVCGEGMGFGGRPARRAGPEGLGERLYPDLCLRPVLARPRNLAAILSARQRH